MITWGRLSDLIKNGRELDFNSTLTFVFSQDHIQLFAIELNTGSPNNNEYGQLFLHGENPEGIELANIGGEYSDITKEIKRSQGLPFDRVTLYDNGDLYRSWDFVQVNGGFVLRANTIKEGVDLRDRWEQFIGLSNESISLLGNEVLSDIINYILSTLLR